MQRALTWIAVGVIAMSGGLAFALRSAVGLHLALDAPTILVASALGAAIASAMMTRHAPTRPAAEPILAAAISFALLITLALATLDTHTFTEPLALLSRRALAAVGATVLAAAAIGAAIARGVPASDPSTPLLLLTSGLLTMGTTMLLILSATAIHGARTFSGWFAIPVLLSVVAGGFLAQAIAAVRRPWACGCGGVLLMLVLLQERNGGVVLATFLVGFLTLIGTIGSRIAGRVFAQRFATAPSALPAAHIESTPSQ